jgi:membrane protease YdiL (CAAX protease family)
LIDVQANRGIFALLFCGLFLILLLFKVLHPSRPGRELPRGNAQQGAQGDRTEGTGTESRSDLGPGTEGPGTEERGAEGVKAEKRDIEERTAEGANAEDPVAPDHAAEDPDIFREKLEKRLFSFLQKRPFYGLLIGAIFVLVLGTSLTLVVGLFVAWWLGYRIPKQEKVIAVGWSGIDVLLACLFFLLLQVTTVQILKGLGVFPSGDGGKKNPLLFFLSGGLNIVTCILLYGLVRFRGQGIREFGVVVRGVLKNILLAVAGYVMIFPLFFVAALLGDKLARSLGHEPVVHPIYPIVFTEESPWVLAGIFTLAVVVAPLTEEFFFRGFTLPALRRFSGRWGAILLTSGFFALIHPGINSFLPIFVLGFLLGYLYEKTQSLVAPIAVHVIHNGTFVSLMFLMRWAVGGGEGG